jgi:uncharacterized protein
VPMNDLLQILVLGAIAAGLLGGAHCAAMCGGIVGAICGKAGTHLPWRRVLAYNAGRIASYAIAGAIVGALGQAGLWLRGDVWLRQLFMAGAGAALVLLALFLAGWSPVVRLMDVAGGILWRRLQPYTRHFLPADTVPRALGLGLLWGWLPCGMVYAVLLTAGATGNVLHGALVMTAFGLATLPNLLAVAVFAQKVRQYAGLRALRLGGALVIAAFGLYGIVHVLHPGVSPAPASAVTNADPASLHH